MPPRKSDPVRRSDTTNAQFVLKDDIEIRNSTPTSSLQPTATATEMETDRPSESAPPTDKEKKEGRDSITIEVYCILLSFPKKPLPEMFQIKTNKKHCVFLS